MLWSLLKIVIFVCIVGAMAFGVTLLTDPESELSQGSLELRFAGYEFVLSPIDAIIVLVLLVIAIWLLLKVAGFLVACVRFITGDETAISRYFSRNRERKGYRALGDGMIALAEGEGREALAQAKRAEKYLRNPSITSLMKAQAAELMGDTKKAESSYRTLLEEDRTRFIGVRGIMQQKLAAGDTETAMKLAEKALALKPKHVETQDKLLELQAGSEDWEGARKTLSTKLKYGALPRDVHKRRDAVLALGQARAIASADDGENDSIEAREAAIEANRMSPDLIPAAVQAAQGYIDSNQPRYAARVVKKAWTAQPHPDLASVFARIDPDETPFARVKRFQPLLRINPDHPETQMLKTELFIAAEDFPNARRALGDLATEEPTARAITLMAAVEKGEGASDAVVRGWLAKAVTAPRGPQWVCENCGAANAQWSPTCDSCGSFDTLTWKRPKSDVIGATNAPDMLPLIVGQIEANPSDQSPLDADVQDANVIDVDVVEPDMVDSQSDGDVQDLDKEIVPDADGSEPQSTDQGAKA